MVRPFPFAVSTAAHFHFAPCPVALSRSARRSSAVTHRTPRAPTAAGRCWLRQMLLRGRLCSRGLCVWFTRSTLPKPKEQINTSRQQILRLLFDSYMLTTSSVILSITGLSASVSALQIYHLRCFGHVSTPEKHKRRLTAKAVFSISCSLPAGCGGGPDIKGSLYSQRTPSQFMQSSIPLDPSKSKPMHFLERGKGKRVTKRFRAVLSVRQDSVPALTASHRQAWPIVLPVFYMAGCGPTIKSCIDSINSAGNMSWKMY